MRAALPLRADEIAPQALLGHSSIVTTQRYAHLNPANLTDPVAMLERVTAYQSRSEPECVLAHVTDDGT